MKFLKGGLVLGAAIFAGMNVADAQQMLKVGYAPFNAPVAFLPGATAANYRTLNGGAQGALIDLLSAVAKDAGLKFEFRAIVAGEQVAELSARKIDIITVSAGITPESKAKIVFTAPVYITSEALIVRKGDNKQYRTFEDLRGEVVGVQRGTVSADGLLKSGIFASIKQYNSGAELEQAVSNGEVKAGFDSSAFGAIYRLQQDRSAGWQICESYQPRYVNPNSIGARTGEEALARTIDGSFAKLKADGTARAIFARFGVERALAN